ncbi:MAG: hypothetical protein KGS72_21530 [Cyanobacteria bacterium REEB67]|nr:hypothetical protein [Cyanobacteria bacterium REEB67]
MVTMAKHAIYLVILSAFSAVYIAFSAYAVPSDTDKSNTNQNIATGSVAVTAAPEDYLKASILSATQHGQERSVPVLTAAFVLLKVSEMVRWPLLIIVIALSAKIILLAGREFLLSFREQSERRDRFAEELKNLKAEGARVEALGGQEKKKVDAEIAEILARSEQEKKKNEAEIAQLQSRTESDKRKSSAEIEQITQQVKVQLRKLDAEASQNEFRTRQRLAVGLIAQISDPEKKSEMTIKAFEQMLLKPGENPK